MLTANAWLQAYWRAENVDAWPNKLAISRVRDNGTSMIERESLDTLPNAKIALIEQAGCIAVLVCAGKANV